MSRHKHFSLVLLMLLASISGWADTTSLTESNGWTKVTDLSSLTLGDYYFAFVDNDNDLMLSFEEGVNQTTADGYKTMVYRTGENAEMNPAMLWTLAANASTSTAFTIKSATNQDYFLQTEWGAGWYCHIHDNGGGSESWGSWNIEYADDSWTIQNNTYNTGYIGPWEGTIQNGAEVAGNKTDDAVGHFQIYAILKSAVDWEGNATEDNPANYTFAITNHSFERGTAQGWTNGTVELLVVNSTNFSNEIGACYAEDWWAAGAVDCHQTVTGLPDGKYQVRVLALCAKGSGSYVYAGDQQTEITNSTGVPASAFTVDADVSGGSLTFGVRGTKDERSWLAVDNFELYYYGPTIAGKSTDASVPLTATASTWYAITIPVAGTYTLTPSAGTLKYSQNGDLYPSEVTASTTSATDLALEAGTLYVMCDAAATITLVAKSYSYVVGEPTLNITYLQGGETVTVTYADLGTNDPDASLSINPTGVTFNGSALTCTATAKGFSFTAPATTAGQSYTLSIPAGVITYAGHTSSAAQTFTMYAPTVFDGTYYLQNESGQYMSRGAGWGTHAIVDDWGQPLEIATAGDGYTTLKFLDSNLYLFNNGSNIWCDGTDPTNTNTKWTFSLADGKYRLTSAEQTGKYVKQDAGDVDLWSDGTDETVIQNWTLEAPADHPSKMEALRTAMTTLSSEVSGLSSKTYLTASASATAEEYQGTTCVGANTSILSKSISVLPGIYKFTIQAFHRIGFNDVSYPRHSAGTDCVPVYAYFGDTKVQLYCVYDATTTASGDVYSPDSQHSYPNSQGTALAAFQEGSYVNTIWVRVTDPGTITYGIQNQGRLDNNGMNNGRWTCYATDGIEITRYYDPITDGEDEDSPETVDGITLNANSYFARGSENIFGRFTISGTTATPTEEGFCYSAYKQEPTTADSTTTSYLDYCGKIYKIWNLSASTPYYVRPYAIINGTTYYGATHKVYTIAKGTITYGIRSSDESTYDTNVTNAIELLVGYWNCYTNISGYYVNAGYVSGVGTADCSYGGYMRFGPNTSYQQCGTAMHESLHGIGVGTGEQWSTLCYGKNWTGPRVNKFLRFFENSEAVVMYGDSQHAWVPNSNGGLSYTINGASEDAYNDLQRTGNSLLAQALGEDGLKPTSGAYYFVPYYSIEQEETDLFYIKNSKNGLYLVDDNGTLSTQSFSTLHEAQKAGAGWRFKFNPSTQWYTITSIKNGNYLSHENYVWGINKYDTNIAIVESVNNGKYWLNTPTQDGRNLLGDLSCGYTGIVDTGDSNGQDWVITRIHRIKGDVDRNGLVETADVVAISNILLGKDSSAYDLVAADMNCSGTVSIEDLTRLVHVLVEQ